jgi:hypothetical protein
MENVAAVYVSIAFPRRVRNDPVRYIGIPRFPFLHRSGKLPNASAYFCRPESPIHLFGHLSSFIGFLLPGLTIVLLIQWNFFWDL